MKPTLNISKTYVTLVIIRLNSTPSKERKGLDVTGMNRVVIKSRKFSTVMQFSILLLYFTYRIGAEFCRATSQIGFTDEPDSSLFPSELGIM